MTTTFLTAKNNATSTLNGAVNGSSDPVTVNVASGEGVRFPTTFPFHITIDSEILRCTARTTDALTCVRAQEGTTIASHSSGATVELRPTAQALKEVQDAVNTLEATPLQSVPAPTAPVSLAGQRATNLGTPTAADDAVPKTYADAIAAGLDPHASVKVATTGNITLSGTQTIDGVAVVATDRVLVKAQTDNTQNGIYDVAAGAWSRSADANTGAELTGGSFTFVEQGTVHADQGWVATHNGTPTFGTTAITFTQFTGVAGSLSGEVAGSTSATSIQVHERLHRVVNYVDGLDSNDGQTPWRAKKTIQAAYDNLVTVATQAPYAPVNNHIGVGSIELIGRDHQVVDGLVLDARRSCEIFGSRAGRHSHYALNSAARLVSSSSTATAFILIDHATEIGYGFDFHDFAFLMDHTVNTSLRRFVHAKATDHLKVRRCSATNLDGVTNTAVVLVDHESHVSGGGALNDNAWARISDNNVSRVALYKGSGLGLAGAYNRSRINDNVVFYGGIPLQDAPNGVTNPSGSITQINTKVPHGLVTGDVVCIYQSPDEGAPTPAGVIGEWTATVIDADSFQIALSFPGTGGDGVVSIHPMIRLAGETNGMLCDGNNLEGSAVGVELGPTGVKTQNTFLNNSGEDPMGGNRKAANPFYDVTGSCSQTLFIGGICSVPGHTSAANDPQGGTWIRFKHASAYNNLVIGPYNADGVLGFKRKIVDQSTQYGNALLHPNHRLAVKTKAGTGAISDADYPSGQPPPIGTPGVTNDKFWVKAADGTWKSVAIA